MKGNGCNGVSGGMKRKAASENIEKNYACVAYPNWMKEIPDDTPLNKMTIPGRAVLK